MENLVVNQEKYDRIFINEDGTLFKYSVIDKDTWKRFKLKKLSFVNTPSKILELENSNNNYYFDYKSIIILPFLKNYKTLYDEKFTQNLDTKDILEMLKKNLLLLKKMHDEKVFHTDIFSKNIMINKNYDIQFIDFDSAVIDDTVSVENVYLEDNISIDEIKDYSRKDDKIDLLNLYINYLNDGNFMGDRYKKILINGLGLKKQISDELNLYNIYNVNPSKDYYFEDIIDDLLKSGYEAPVLLKRNKKIISTLY